jgi:serine O-acetyltransferase
MSDSRSLQSHRTRKSGLIQRLGRFVFDSGVQALALHRAAHFFYCLGVPIVPMLIRRLNVFLTGADIFPSARIGRDVALIHSVGIVIGEKVVIEDNCDIYGQVVLGGRGGKTRGNDQPHIGRDSVICIGAKVLGKVYIGCCSTIAAGAVVLSSVPEHSLAAGVPATVKRKYDTSNA